MNDSKIKKEFKHRSVGLDMIRAIAILLVVSYHSFYILKPLIKLPYIGNLINKIGVLLDWIGPLGVDLFFVLSGFLIGTILINIFLKSENFALHEVKNFWIRRWFRTIPNYYLLLTFAFILYYLKYDISFNWKYYFFIQNFTTVHPLFFGEAWSLAVEEWFYLTLPVLLYLLNFILKKQSKKVILKVTILCYLIVFIVLRLIKAGSHNYVDFDAEIRKVVIYRLDAVMYGVIIAYFMYFREELLYKNKTKLLLTGLFASIVLVSLFFFASVYSTIYMKNELFRFIVDSSYFTLIPFFFSLLIPAAYFLVDIKHALIKKVIIHISLISYSIYLIHYAIIYVPFFKGLKNISVTASILYYLLYWVIVLCISTINYHFFEKPITKFRDLLSKSE